MWRHQEIEFKLRERFYCISNELQAIVMGRIISYLFAMEDYYLTRQKHWSWIDYKNGSLLLYYFTREHYQLGQKFSGFFTNNSVDTEVHMIESAWVYTSWVKSPDPSLQFKFISKILTN